MAALLAAVKSLKFVRSSPSDVFLAKGVLKIFSKCDALRHLVPFVQFKKCEKHPRRSVNFRKACNFTKINTPPWVFFTFFKLYKWYRTNGTKSRNASQIRCSYFRFTSVCFQCFIKVWNPKVAILWYYEIQDVLIFSAFIYFQFLCFLIFHEMT